MLVSPSLSVTLAVRTLQSRKGVCPNLILTNSCYSMVVLDIFSYVTGSVKRGQIQNRLFKDITGFCEY